VSETSSVSEDDDPTGTLTMESLQFTWKIPNFLNATFRDEFKSPTFSVADEPGMKVCSCINPFGPEPEDDSNLLRFHVTKVWRKDTTNLFTDQSL
jgi:hypothetical protein